MSAVVETIEIGYCERCNKVQQRFDESPTEWVDEHNEEHHTPETETPS